MGHGESASPPKAFKMAWLGARALHCDLRHKRVHHCNENKHVHALTAVPGRQSTTLCGFHERHGCGMRSAICWTHHQGDGAVDNQVRDFLGLAIKEVPRLAPIPTEVLQPIERAARTGIQIGWKAVRHLLFIC